jgi:uncharacterized repeat protein (TIGR03803 family)
MVLLRTLAVIVTLGWLATGCTVRSDNASSSAEGITPSLFAKSHVHASYVIETPKSHESVLHSFMARPDGEDPLFVTLIVDESGDLYGTTLYGGANDQGTVYKLTPSKSGFDEKVLYSFKGGIDGIAPSGGLVADKSGAVYGTTTEGGGDNCGNAGCGTVFKLAAHFNLDATRSETVLYRFQGSGDGYDPSNALLVDKSGTLYGTTFLGGSGGGTVFKLSPTASGYQKTTLYGFQGTDGASPVGDLISDKSNAIYGATAGGGAHSAGTVYKLVESTLYTLYSFQGNADGQTPQAGVVADSSGALYGTTYYGGTGTGCKNGIGCGTVFKLTPTRTGYSEKVLHSFQGGNDGFGPEAGVTLDHGAIYGTTELGGNGNCTGGAGDGCGVIFKLSPAGSGYKETIIHSFQNGDDGAAPYSGLTNVNGNLFGVTFEGGASGGYGTVYELAK